MEQWYALHCKPNSERIVAEKLGHERIEAFYPHSVQKSRDGYRSIELKFFPGYAFARFDLLHSRPAVVEIPQVVSILGWGRHPVAIPDFEVDAVRLIVNTPQVKAAADCPFVTAGDRVRVTRGPLRDLEGFVVYTKGGARVIVSISMLARSISAEVDGDALELLDGREGLKKAA